MNKKIAFSTRVKLTDDFRKIGAGIFCIVLKKIISACE